MGIVFLVVNDRWVFSSPEKVDMDMNRTLELFILHSLKSKWSYPERFTPNCKLLFIVLRDVIKKIYLFLNKPNTNSITCLSWRPGNSAQ